MSEKIYRITAEQADLILGDLGDILHDLTLKKEDITVLRDEIKSLAPNFSKIDEIIAASKESINRSEEAEKKLMEKMSGIVDAFEDTVVQMKKEENKVLERVDNLAKSFDEIDTTPSLADGVELSQLEAFDRKQNEIIDRLDQVGSSWKILWGFTMGCIVTFLAIAAISSGVSLQP